MNHQGTEGVRGEAAPAGTPGARFLLATCGVVATAAYLGASWLRQPLAGLPTGVWVIGIAQAAGRAWSSRTVRRGLAHARGAPALPLAPGVPTNAGWAGLDVRGMLGRVGGVAWESTRALGTALRVSPERMVEIESGLMTWLDRRPAAGTSLRIGLDGGPELVRLMRDARSAGSLRVELVPAPPGGTDESVLRSLRLDALVRQEASGAARIVTPESDGRDAAWYDWAAARPLTYGSVFPPRIDPAWITLDEFDAGDATDAGLFPALVLAAAALSRSGARLTLADRLRGRTPLTGNEEGSPADRCLIELTRLVAGLAGEPATPVRKAAARVVSAYLASADAWDDQGLRRGAIDAAAMMLSEEPEVLLRAASVRLVTGDDQGGLAALTRAVAAIQAGAPVAAMDHLAFLQAEVECGLPGPLTLGRVAAGIGLVCATSPVERVPFIRTDVMDDVRHSAWLVGRDQDRAMLCEVFRVLERAATPAKAAA